MLVSSTLYPAGPSSCQTERGSQSYISSMLTLKQARLAQYFGNKGTRSVGRKTIKLRYLPMFLVNPQCKTPVQVRSADLGKVAIDQAGLCSDASNVHLQLLFMITANTISSGKGVNPRMIGLSAKAEHTCACLPHSKLSTCRVPTGMERDLHSITG